MFENIGILVMVNGVVGQNTHRPLSIQEFRAFTLLDEYAPLIFINSKDSPNGKLFSLLHEAAHIWMGKDNFYNDRYGNANGVSDLEVICNAIAAEILVPNDIFAIEWNKRNDLEWNVEKIKVLSRFFKCGATVIARRALDNKLITKDEYDAIAKEAVEYFNQQKAEKISTGGNFYNNIAVKNDKRFVLALNSSMYEGTTQFTEVYRLTNTNRKTFSKLVEQIRGINYGK